MAKLEITEIFYPKTRREWYDWLKKHHKSKSEIWLQRYKKATGKPSISYDDLVEVCLCFGWIDGLVKKVDAESNAQRITPRRSKKSFLSELNRQRVWKLQKQGLVVPGALAAIEDQVGLPDDPLELPEWVKTQLQEDPLVWENFQNFDFFYQRLKIGWITEPGTRRREEAQRRLDYLIKMTKQGKQYGTQPLKNFKID